MKKKKDGAKILPKVGFHLWQNHFLRWTSRRLRGFEDLRGCKGRLPELAEKPNKAFFLRRWAFPCLTGFEASRRLNLALYGAKVGFFLSDCLKRLLRWASRLRGLEDCQRWASMLRRWAFPEVRPKVGFYSYLWPKVGFHSPLVGSFFDGLPKVGFSCLTGFEASRTAKGGLFSFGRLPELAEKPNKAFFGQRWAFPCLTIFKTARRLNLALYGPKVGFHSPLVGSFFDDCQRWASILLWWASMTAKGRLPKVGFQKASKVGFLALFGLIMPFPWNHTFIYIYYTL